MPDAVASQVEEDDQMCAGQFHVVCVCVIAPTPRDQSTRWSRRMSCSEGPEILTTRNRAKATSLRCDTIHVSEGDVLAAREEYQHAPEDRQDVKIHNLIRILMLG